ncbi:fibronectin type III domain-containing protein 1 isoform X3 [Oreochromis niloticus]|uniref:fibronectin type III domain-containing protein 1 isoform X3 n=1 Tax=Oreochromis niloticus TaxID=8128 RepID=UPI000393EBA2|nr:fibronectin type III domain-containing protein 1 isoform X3 [Oreochromis niloticus]
MALATGRTLVALFLTLCGPGCSWAAEKPPRPQNVKPTSVEKGLRESWEPSIHLDGRPVDRFMISSSKPTRSHRFTKASKDSRAPMLEDVDPEWVNLDGFAVLGGAPVSNLSAGPVRSSQTVVPRNHSSVKRATRMDRKAQLSGVPNVRTHRRAPQSSSGPRQPERVLAGVPLLERRRQHYAKPQSDQRNRLARKLTSESVHVVSLQAQKAQGQSEPANRAVTTKTTTPAPPEHEAQDISVRVMSPKSVLISWVDPAVEMEKVAPGASRSYTVRYREKGESARWEYKESTQRRILIDTLSADSMYEFSVRISQEENHSKWSVSVFQRTPESAPSGPPENFEVKPLRGKGTAVVATWDPPEEPNGRIREYILTYVPAMKPFETKSVKYYGSTTTATIDGLTPGDRYIFTIKATNRKGQGPQSKTFSVAMPGSSSATSAFSKSKDSRRTGHTPSKQDTDHDDIQSTEAPEIPTIQKQPLPAAPVSRRFRPLSQTRSYHSIFSSVRGSIRKAGNRGSNRRRAKNDEEEEEEEEEENKVPTTPPPVEETTTMEFVPEPKETDNDVSPETEDEDEYDEEPLTTKTPSLKVLTPSPTKPAFNRLNPPRRRPFKIRVHQKAGSKDASAGSSSSSSSASSSSSSSSSASSSSSSASSSSSSSSSNSPTSTSSSTSLDSSSSSSSSPSTTSLSSPSLTQESAASRKDYIALTYPESKNIFEKSSITHAKPSTSLAKRNSSQQTHVTPVGRGSTSAGRASGTGFGSRYGLGRRYPGSLLRGNSTRMLNGYKPAVISQSSSPRRTQSQVTSNIHSSATSQATLPENTQNHEKSSTLNPSISKSKSGRTSNGEDVLDSYNSDKSRSTLESRSHGSTSLQVTNPSTSQRNANTSTANTSGLSQRTSQRGSHSSARSRDTHNSQSSHTSSERDTSNVEGNDDTNYKNTERELTKVEDSALTTITQPTEKPMKKDKEKDEGAKEKPPVSAGTRVRPSFAERYPWLASRYPGKVISTTRITSPRQDSRVPLTRMSSSVGAGRPVLRGTTTRVSGATGAAGVPSLQETSEDPSTSSTRDSLKNGFGASSVKPSLINQNVGSGGARNPTTSSSSSSSSPSISSSPDHHHSLSGHRDSSEPSHRELTNAKSSNEDYLSEKSGENDKVADPIEAQEKPAESDKNAEDNASVDTGESSPRTRPGTSSGVPLANRRPGVGVNGRVRSPLLPNRQFGGSRLPLRVQPAQNSRLGSSTSDSISSSSDSASSSNLPQPVRTSDSDISSGTTVTRTGELIGGNSHSTLASSSSSSSRDSFRNNGSRPRYSIRGKQNNGRGIKPGNGNGKNGRPNLTATDDKESSSSHGTSKATGQRFITGPDGTKWVVDLEQGILMNGDGRVLQDSQGKPKRVVLGEDGRTIFDHMGSPLVSQDGIALFGHGRDSQPVINPKDKVLMVGGKRVLGLDRPRPRTSTTTTTATTTTTTTTTMAPTTTPEPTTIDWTTEEFTTGFPYPTCPPGTFSKTDEYGYPVLDSDGILDCYPEEDSSGMEMDFMLTMTRVPDALVLKKDEFVVQTTPPPTTTTATTTTTTTTTTTKITTPEVHIRPMNKGPSNEFDLSGKKRFTAPYVNYIQKDPGAPCSLTEALEYLQVDILENLMKNDSLAANHNQPPKNKPHNFTVVAMEGCHSFIILDWARPLKDDMVSGYMVQSASYDDILNNRWSSKAATGTHLAVENLKPNSRYYFRVQAKNVFGVGPFSETLSYVTESDDPLLIERPPGGEPIWIPYSFKFNPVHSSCKGSQYVKRTWYRKFVGVVLCNSLRYKIFMGDSLRDPFYSIGDTFGQGEDHCQFVDSYRDGRTGPAYLSNNLPTVQGYYRSYRQEPVTFGVIGRRTAHPFVGWYECGVPIPGKW